MQASRLELLIPILLIQSNPPINRLASYCSFQVPLMRRDLRRHCTLSRELTISILGPKS